MTWWAPSFIPSHVTYGNRSTRLFLSGFPDLHLCRKVLARWPGGLRLLRSREGKWAEPVLPGPAGRTQEWGGGQVSTQRERQFQDPLGRPHGFAQDPAEISEEMLISSTSLGKIYPSLFSKQHRDPLDKVFAPSFCLPWVVLSV